jgi:hypothetical protein
MEGREKPHMDKYKEITNDWIYDASCMITSLLVWDFQALDFCSTKFTSHKKMSQNFIPKCWFYIKKTETI